MSVSKFYYLEQLSRRIEGIMENNAGANRKRGYDIKYITKMFT